jgi:tetratricopeptide (TPR) repeat protein
MNRQHRRAAARRGQARAVQQNRDSPAYWNNYGQALHNLGRLEGAVASYDRALALRPDLAEIHYNRANSLQSLARLDEAVAGYDRAIALRPDMAEAYANRGSRCRRCGGSPRRSPTSTMPSR